jgi:hypothetical protein
LVLVTSKRPGWARSVCSECATDARDSDPYFWHWFWHKGDSFLDREEMQKIEAETRPMSIGGVATAL